MTGHERGGKPAYCTKLRGEKGGGAEGSGPEGEVDSCGLGSVRTEVHPGVRTARINPKIPCLRRSQ